MKYLGRWTDGVQAPAVGIFDRLRIWNRQLSSAEIANLDAAQSVTLPPLGPSGTVVDLGNADDNETTTFLSAGGNAHYDASGMIWRTRWLGNQGCSSPNRSATTNQFLIRFDTAHDGGSIRGGAIYGNLTSDDDYDPGDHGFALYPCSDGGQLYFGNNRDVNNFTTEGWRMHSCWDPFRTPGRANATTLTLTFKGCWITCCRDDVFENDGKNSIDIEGNLIGDTIGQNVGTWVFLSMTTGSDKTDKVVNIRGNLVWSSLMRATSRPRNVNGYACGVMFKIQNSTSGPELHIHDNVFMYDHLTISGGGGDPLHGLKQHFNNFGGNTSSSGNILIWRDRGHVGSWASLGFDVPPGFTVLEGSEGESEWNSRVAAWKAAHPNVRRLNKTGIARPFGGTTSVVDQG